MRQILLALSLMLFLCVAYAEGITSQQTTIPMNEAGAAGLETLLVWPTTPGKHPLVLINHGSPRNAAERKNMSAMNSMPVAIEFARRGYVAAVVLRRGYGHSGGEWAENYGNCDVAGYERAAQADSLDLHAALKYLSALPQVDANHIMLVGHSAGGFATLALSADHPPQGLEAAIIFAAGRGSKSNENVCGEDALVAVFGEFGKTSRVPMLWIYAQNDHFFNPALARRFATAFNNAGGNAKLSIVAPYGDEGHYLFSQTKGMPVWLPMVDAYLVQQHLMPQSSLLPYPAAPVLTPPHNLSDKGKKDFAEFAAGPLHKAFAMASNGAYGWATGHYSVEEAEAVAIKNCSKYARDECEIYFEDDRAL